LIAALGAALTVLLLVTAGGEYTHWFVIPVFLCGAIAGNDVVDWIRGRIDTFDVAGLSGIFMTFNMFLAPLLHVKWNIWMWEVVPPPDWRDWLGRMAVFNVLGLLAYSTTRMFVSRGFSHKKLEWVWVPNLKLFWVVSAITLGVTAGLQAMVFQRYGGLSGYIESFQDKAGGHFDGMGWVFVISESFPVVLALVFIVYRTRRPAIHRWAPWIAFLLAVFILRTLFGGLRGSRMTMVLALFWAAGAIHLMVRPIPKRMAALGGVAILAFMYAYLAYKDSGDVSQVLETGEWTQLHEAHHRSFKGILLGDLNRTDVQAYVLYKLTSDPDNVIYAQGKTYLAALSLLIPRQILPERPPSKVIYGTDLIYGPGAYAPKVISSSRIYGLAGEAMLNFTPVAIPFAFVILGIVIGSCQVFVRSLRPGDIRLFLVPYLVYLCTWVFMGDLDNVVFSMVYNAVVPGLVIAISSRRVPYRQLCEIEDREPRSHQAYYSARVPRGAAAYSETSQRDETLPHN
jgi:hypothetical protein